MRVGISFVVVVALAFSASAEDILNLQDYGLYTIFLHSQLLSCKLDKNQSLDVSETELYMYDFEKDVNKIFYLNVAAEDLAKDKSFDPSRRTILYIPGFHDKPENSSKSESVRRNLKNISGMYLYIVDHHKYTTNGEFILTAYEKAVKYYYDIGIAIAKFLCNMVGNGIKADDIMVLGHSLGGQIAGAVGEVFHEQCGQLIASIKGMDPAGPCFDKADVNFQLRSGLAQHTETYHCDRNQLGTGNDLTDAYYYVNNGQSQPYCFTPALPTLILSAAASNCSHNSCPNVVTLSASIQNIWQALPCDSYTDFRDSACAHNGAVIAGIFSKSSNRGKYYYSTAGYIKEKLIN